MLAGLPIFLRGCLSSLACILVSLFNKNSAIGVLVREGATQLTATLGASSAAIEIAKPCKAPFAAAIEPCIGIPTFVATLVMKTTEPPSSFLSIGNIPFNA